IGGGRGHGVVRDPFAVVVALQARDAFSRAKRAPGAAMRFTDQERAQYRRDGFVLRTAVLTPAELDALRGTVEEVVARVVAHARRQESGPEFRLGGHRLQLSSRTVIQWEWRDGSP